MDVSNDIDGKSAVLSMRNQRQICQTSKDIFESATTHTHTGTHTHTQKNTHTHTNKDTQQGHGTQGQIKKGIMEDLFSCPGQLNR